MKPWVAGLIAVLATPSAAFATGSIFCTSADGAAVDLQLGFVAVTSIIGADISTPEMAWTTRESGGQPMLVLQSFVGPETILVDFTDPNFEDVLAELRLFYVDGALGQAKAGTLNIAGVGVYALTCEGP
jgi:hypothetical protein